MRREQLIDLVIQQIRDDLLAQDETAIYELLDSLTRDKLFSFLPEDKQNEITQKAWEKVLD